MLLDEDNYLEHYGILRKSGRYPWGSGDTQGQRNKDFIDYVDGLKKQGLSDAVIAKGVGLTSTELRAAKSIAKNAAKQADINEAQRLKDKGLSNVEIGKKLGRNESYVRTLLVPGSKDKADILTATSNMLKKEVAEKKYIDIGAGVENHLGIAKTKLKTAVAMLEEEGYTIHYFRIEQLGTGKLTTLKVLAAPGVNWSDVNANKENIRQITEFTQDGGRSYLNLAPPLSISSRRVSVRYAEDGGATADGVIYVRPGVSDVSLGGSRYAQVRIAIDGTHYLKGMAMYKDDLPRGVDLQFNTNKSNTGNKLDAMKKMSDDPDNPFGSFINRQIIELDKNGKEVATSAMNIVNEEANWEKWSKSLSSQMLSKQNPRLITSQLAMTYEKKNNEFEAIMSLTNPTVRRSLLEDFADSADSSAVHLKAAALPRMSTHVILPVNSLKDTEIYAPTFKNGEPVVLIRHPHGGKFEIPELIVNNRNPEARKSIGTEASAAVGINSKVAERLSGADFDGDSVLVIPNSERRVSSAPPLEGLKNFDTKAAYPPYPGMKPISTRNKEAQMGIVSNLITDMTIRGASQEEIARAVRHSMVVIDSEKHNLDYKQSAIDNNIRQLHKKYQDSSRGGAATLISRAGSEIRVPERRPRPSSEGGPVDKATGKKMFKSEPESYIDRNGKLVIKTIKSKRLAETEDAFTLSSGTVVETIYANHSNRLKALANQARKEAVNTKDNPYSPSAKKIYADEVKSLNAKLNTAKMNQPLERQAQLIANTTVSAKRQAKPDMPDEELKKVKSQALNAARFRTGAGKEDIDITPREWEAIQAGAISPTKLKEILNNTKPELVKQLAMPKTPILMTSAKTNRARSMIESGYTLDEVASALGVSLTTLKNSVGGS